HEAIESLFKERAAEGGLYCFRIDHLERTRLSSDGSALALGRLRVTSSITEESLETTYAALHMGGHDVHCVLKAFPDLVRHAEVKETLLGRFTQASITD